MLISVTLLMDGGNRLSAYAIKSQVPVVGWLHYDVSDYGLSGHGVRARLVSESGIDLLPWLEHARLVACRGKSGALIEGVQYRKKGAKHSISGPTGLVVRVAA